MWALEQKRLFWFSVAFTTTCFIKWQPLILAPFILGYLLRRRMTGDFSGPDLKQWLVRAVLPCCLVIAALLTIFGFEIFRTLARGTFGITDPVLSGNALNINWILTHFLRWAAPERFGPLEGGFSDHISMTGMKIALLPIVAFVIAYLTVLVTFLRRENSFGRLLLFSLTGYLAYFVLSTGVHENHLFIACILGILLYRADRACLGIAAAVALAANLNLLVFYGIDGRGLPFPRMVGGVDMALVLSLLYVSLFGLLFYAVVKGGRCGQEQGRAEP
jgi:hypothetical protein